MTTPSGIIYLKIFLKTFFKGVRETEVGGCRAIKWRKVGARLGFSGGCL